MFGCEATAGRQSTYILLGRLLDAAGGGDGVDVCSYSIFDFTIIFYFLTITSTIFVLIFTFKFWRTIGSFHGQKVVLADKIID
jgi:hypothetical protein